MLRQNGRHPLPLIPTNRLVLTLVKRSSLELFLPLDRRRAARLVFIASCSYENAEFLHELLVVSSSQLDIDIMSSSLDNLGWFYRGKVEQATGIKETLDHKIVYALLVTFTVTGFLAIASYIVQFIRLLLSLFVLPGKPVRYICILSYRTPC